MSKGKKAGVIGGIVLGSATILGLGAWGIVHAVTQDDEMMDPDPDEKDGEPKVMADVRKNVPDLLVADVAGGQAISFNMADEFAAEDLDILQTIDLDQLSLSSVQFAPQNWDGVDEAQLSTGPKTTDDGTWTIGEEGAVSFEPKAAFSGLPEPLTLVMTASTGKELISQPFNVAFTDGPAVAEGSAPRIITTLRQTGIMVGQPFQILTEGEFQLPGFAAKVEIDGTRVDTDTTVLLPSPTSNPENDGTNTLDVAGVGTWTVDDDGDLTFTPGATPQENSPPAVWCAMQSIAGEGEEARWSNPFAVSAGAMAFPQANDVNVAPLGDDDESDVNVVPVRWAQGPTGGDPDKPGALRAAIKFLANDDNGDQRIDPASAVIVGMHQYSDAILNYEILDDGKKLEVTGEGTWTIDADGDDPDGPTLTFASASGFERWPSPIAYQVADVLGNYSNVAYVWLDRLVGQVINNIHDAVSMSDDDYWQQLGGSIISAAAFDENQPPRPADLGEIGVILYAQWRLTLKSISMTDIATINVQPRYTEQMYQTMSTAFATAYMDAMMEPGGMDADGLTSSAQQKVTQELYNQGALITDAVTGLADIERGTRLVRLQLMGRLVEELTGPGE